MLGDKDVMKKRGGKGDKTRKIYNCKSVISFTKETKCQNRNNGGKGG